MPSHDPASPQFESLRYWRGPLWLGVNYLIAGGLTRAGEVAMADRLVASSMSLIETAGFAAYDDPLDGTPCGGGRFTWAAAMVIEFHERSRKTTEVDA